MRIILADDQPLIRYTLSLTLKALFPDPEVIQVGDAVAAISACHKHIPDVVILDMKMAGMDVMEATKQIRGIRKDTPVLILSDCEDIDIAYRCYDAGCSGLVLKSDDIEDLKYAIQTVLRRGRYTPPSLAEGLHEYKHNPHNIVSKLTPKERTVLSLVAQGMQIKEVASALTISRKTAETHRANLGLKLGHPTRAQLVMFALQPKLIDSGSVPIPA